MDDELFHQGNYMRTVKKPSRRYIVFLIGFTLYCIWSTSVSVTLSIAANHFGDASATVWVSSNITTLSAMAVFRMLYRRIDRMLDARITQMAILVSAPLGMMSLLSGMLLDILPLCILGGAIASLANAFQILLWGRGFQLLVSDAECKFAPFFAVVVATLAYQGMIVSGETILLCLTAIAAMASLFFYRAFQKTGPAADSSRHRRRTDSPRSHIPFLAFVLVASVPMNFLTAIAGGMGGENLMYDDYAVMGITSLVLILAMTLEAFAYRRRATFVPLFVVVFFTGAMFLMLFSDGELSALFGVSSYAGFYLFLPMMYYEMAAQSRDGAESSTKVFSSGLLANSIGVTLGTLLSIAVVFLDSLTPALISLLLTYGTIVLAAVFLPNSFYKLFTSRMPSEVERIGNPYREAVETGCERAAGVYRLTQREEDIAVLLVRGRSLTTIARDLGLSSNTIKTHVSHIYQKCGIHSREEFIELFEMTFEG